MKRAPGHPAKRYFSNLLGSREQVWLEMLWIRASDVALIYENFPTIVGAGI